jgi:xanthine phosphoribosyltransferase
VESLKEKIASEGVVLSEKIIIVNSFLNHQIDAGLMEEIGSQFASLFSGSGATKILTAEVSGIPPALATGMKMSIPVVFARKSKPSTMGDEVYRASVTSATSEKRLEILVKKEYLSPSDKVLLIDDFISEGYATKALCDIVASAGATIVGIGTVIEKSFLHGRDRFKDEVDAPIHALVKILKMGPEGIEFE